LLRIDLLLGIVWLLGLLGRLWLLDLLDHWLCGLDGFIEGGERLCRLDCGSGGGTQFEDVDDITTAVGGSGGSRGSISHWLAYSHLYFLLLSGLGQFACDFFKRLFRLHLDLGLSFFLVIITAGGLVILGVFVLVEGGLVVGVVAVSPQAVPVVVGLVIGLLFLVEFGRVAVTSTATVVSTASVVAAATATTAVSPTATVSAPVVVATSAVAAGIAVSTAVGGPSDDVGHLFSNVLGLDAFLLEEFFVAE
jgi:hypothetical protein